MSDTHSIVSAHATFPLQRYLIVSDQADWLQQQEAALAADDSPTMTRWRIGLKHVQFCNTHGCRDAVAQLLDDTDSTRIVVMAGPDVVDLERVLRVGTDVSRRVPPLPLDDRVWVQSGCDASVIALRLSEPEHAAVLGWLLNGRSAEFPRVLPANASSEHVQLERQAHAEWMAAFLQVNDEEWLRTVFDPDPDSETRADDDAAGRDTGDLPVLPMTGMQRMVGRMTLAANADQVRARAESAPTGEAGTSRPASIERAVPHPGGSTDRQRPAAGTCRLDVVEEQGSLPETSHNAEDAVYGLPGEPVYLVRATLQLTAQWPYVDRLMLEIHAPSALPVLAKLELQEQSDGAVVATQEFSLPRSRFEALRGGGKGTFVLCWSGEGPGAAS
jgi:hypothetical protein